MIFIMVDLPQPLLPTSATHSPGLTEKVTLEKRFRVEKDFDKLLICKDMPR